MKLYLVSSDDYSFDEYDAFVVLANSKAEAIKIACTPSGYDTSDCFEDYQKANGLDVEEIDLTNEEPRQILGSFNAG